MFLAIYRSKINIIIIFFCPVSQNVREHINVHRNCYYSIAVRTNHAIEWIYAALLNHKNTAASLWKKNQKTNSTDSLWIKHNLIFILWIQWLNWNMILITLNSVTSKHIFCFSFSFEIIFFRENDSQNVRLIIIWKNSVINE